MFPAGRCSNRSGGNRAPASTHRAASAGRSPVPPPSPNIPRRAWKSYSEGIAACERTGSGCRTAPCAKYCPNPRCAAQPAYESSRGSMARQRAKLPDYGPGIPGPGRSSAAAPRSGQRARRKPSGFHVHEPTRPARAMTAHHSAKRRALCRRLPIGAPSLHTSGAFPQEATQSSPPGLNGAHFWIFAYFARTRWPQILANYTKEKQFQDKLALPWFPAGFEGAR